MGWGRQVGGVGVRSLAVGEQTAGWWSAGWSAEVGTGGRGAGWWQADECRGQAGGAGSLDGGARRWGLVGGMGQGLVRQLLEGLGTGLVAERGGGVGRQGWEIGWWGRSQGWWGWEWQASGPRL